MNEKFIEIVPKRYGFRIVFLSSGVMIQKYYHNGFAMYRDDSYFLPRILAKQILKKEFLKGEKNEKK